MLKFDPEEGTSNSKWDQTANSGITAGSSTSSMMIFLTYTNKVLITNLKARSSKTIFVLQQHVCAWSFNIK